MKKKSLLFIILCVVLSILIFTQTTTYSNFKNLILHSYLSNTHIQNVPAYKSKISVKHLDNLTDVPMLPISPSSFLLDKPTYISQDYDFLFNDKILAPQRVLMTETLSTPIYGFYLSSSSRQDNISSSYNINNALSKPGNIFINSLGGDGLIDPDNGDDDLPPPPLGSPTSDGLVLLVFMTFGYAVIRYRK